MPRKLRLDLHLLTKGLVNSRQKAIQLIRAGKVRSFDGRILDKPGQEISTDLEVIVQHPPRFVSRGGEKLIAAFENFPIKVEKRICLDCGISTGGFTDCLLKMGASIVYGIDVGYGQTAWTLRKDPRVVLRERTNLRKLSPQELYLQGDIWPNLAVADLSFISLKLVMPSIQSLLKEDADLLFLVKPQFEVGKELVGKGGVVRNSSAHVNALTSVINDAKQLNLFPKGLIASPLTGPAGNHEYFIWLSNKSYEFDQTVIEKLVNKTLC